jgi:hypothetical protein
MTNEERRELCTILRWYGDRLEKELSGPMREAADEIERLAKELAKAQRLCGQMLQKQHVLECDALWRRRND